MGNVERQIISRFVTRVTMFEAIYKQSWFDLLTFDIIIITQTFHRMCWFVCVILYNSQSLNYLRWAMSQDCTVFQK